MDPFSSKPIRLTAESAEALAIEALGFLAADENRLAQFVAATGYDLAAIRSQASLPEFQAGLLEFLMSDESLLLVFAGHQGIAPGEVAAARQALLPDTAMWD
jgi:hypothetical protein